MTYINRWLFSTNCKDISILYIIFAIFSGLIATGLSIIIRLELSGPGSQFIKDGQVFNAVITAHGLLMMFLVIIPFAIGFFGNYLVPQMLGAADMSLARLNNLSF
jgi:heme/copper-type cytochrome/quinol oxidase subunit 1